MPPAADRLTGWRAGDTEELLLTTGDTLVTDLTAAVRRFCHGRDHVLPAFVAPSLTVPVLDGDPALGTWQSIVLVDPNRDNPRRRVLLSFLAG